MKRKISFLFAVIFTATVFAKDIQTLVVTTTPQMHCDACERRIKNNIRFEKGVKTIKTSIENQTVTISYDSEKNTESNLIKAFNKFGYKAEIVKEGVQVKKHAGEACPVMPMK